MLNIMIYKLAVSVISPVNRKKKRESYEESS